MEYIGFNKPYITGKESQYIMDAVAVKKLSGNGKYTQLCHAYFQKRYGFGKCLLTTSCTDALEMAAILINTEPGDEVIMPSYTFVSTANAFILRGAKIIFADSMSDNPNMDADKLESLITAKTKAIVPVHYAGVACDMDKIKDLAEKYKLFIIEDAAQAVDSFYIDKHGNRLPLGSIGHLAAFSFHETKNIVSGEGGMLVINKKEFNTRAEIIWEKGTNRSEFFRGETDKYGWVDIGSSFLPSEIIAAFLYAQLEQLDDIQARRKTIWHLYHSGLECLAKAGKVLLPHIPDYATNNAHMFYLVCKNGNERTELIKYLLSQNVQTVFHYLSLHKSKYYAENCLDTDLVNADKYSDCLVRLPFYYELTAEQVNGITSLIRDFYNNNHAVE